MNALIYSPVKLFRKARKSLDKKRQWNKNSVEEMASSSKSPLSKCTSLPVLPSYPGNNPLIRRFSLTMNEEGEDADDEYCNIFKWIDQGILPENEARNLRDVIEDDLAHLQLGETNFTRSDVVQSSLRIDIALKFEAFPIIAKKLTLAYLNIILKNYIEAKTAFRSAKRYLRKCWKNEYILRDYVSGISFVILTLEEFYMEQMEMDIDKMSVRHLSCPQSSTELWVPTFGGLPMSGYMSKFNSLSEISQVGVLGIKCYVMELFGKDINQRINLLNHMLTMESLSFEWYLCLASCLKNQRYNPEFKSGNKAFIPPPSVRERELIKIAITLNPMHPSCLIAECTYIAEISKSHNWGAHLIYGDVILKSMEQVDDFLHRRMNTILQQYNLSTSINIGIAELFRAHVPNKDLRLVKERLDWILQLHPKCGKALYQLGLYHLQSEERNIDSASSYFIRAFECDHRHFSALTDLLNIYLNNSTLCGERIMAIISKYLKNPLSSWNGFHIASLLFLEGCYLYMDSSLGGTKNAVLCWINCFKTCQNTWKFRISTFPHGDYQPAKLTLSNIKAAVLEQTRLHYISEQEKHTLRQMATGSYWYPWSQKRFAIS